MGGYISQDPIKTKGGIYFYKYVRNVNWQIDILGLSIVTIIYNHKLKDGKVTDLAELNRQMDEQIAAYNKILKEEGISGLQERVAGFTPEIEKQGRAYTSSLGSVGEDKIWAHTPDMKTGGGPKDVSSIPAGARENSILGGNANRISREISEMDDDVTEFKGELNLH